MLEPLRLYQIPWSHFCDKVRWALDLKGLPYECISYNLGGQTPGLEHVPPTLLKLTPIIEDPNYKGERPYFLSDSTPILLYLDRHYPPPSLLFPSDERQSVINACIRLDSELGPAVRRLIYVQMLGEYPNILCVSQSANHRWANNPEDLRSRLVARFAACFLIARFRLHRIREEQVREKTERLLLEYADHLKQNKYLVGQQFTAADLTFCSLFRPLELIPYFRDDERLEILYDYHDRIRAEHDLKYAKHNNIIRKLMDEHRSRKTESTIGSQISRFFDRINVIKYCLFWLMCSIVSKLYGPATDEEQPVEFASEDQSATNDHRNLNIRSKWGALSFAIKYNFHRCFTMPRQIAYLKGETTE